MKYILIIGLTFVYFGCTKKSELKIVNLKCEYQTTPLGIDNLHPRLSWQMESSVRNQKQLAYHILVSESLEELDQDIGKVWDSKKVQSDQSISVPFDGKILQSGKQYYWKVKVWDQDKKQTPWSNPSNWTMGFLDDKDWKANWIGVNFKNKKDLVNQYAAVQFRKEVRLKKKPKKAIARFSGLGFGEMYINGQKVSNDKMAPGWTDYNKKVYYMTYDITNQLQKGQNAFGVLLGNGWYNLPTADLFAYEKAPWKSNPKFLLNITIDYDDGSSSQIISDESWKSGTSHITFNCIRGGETIDARKVQKDWDKVNFDDKKWENSIVVDPPLGKLTPQAIPAEQVMKLIQPIKLSEPKPGVYVYDLGVHIAGWVKFKASGKEGQLLTLDFDENLNEDGTITIKSLDSHTYGRYQVGELILSGKGFDVFEPRFTYHGFRYIQIKGLSFKPKLDDLIAAVVHNNLDPSVSFESSKVLLNKVHHAFKYAIQNSLHSVQTEPAREKINWTQDAHNVMEGLIFNFDSYTFVNKWLDDIIESQEINGHIPPINPAANWGFTKSNGMPPDWSDPWWGGCCFGSPMVYIQLLW
ncbi:MAG: family 78 glycoside hydrolase catalytic domain [Flavobacteriaceae bacterium]